MALKLMMKRIRFAKLAGWFFLALCAGWAGLTSAQGLSSLPPEVVRAWGQTKLPESSLSLVVKEIGGPRIAAVNPAEPRNPASVMKLVTTWAAISQLGPNYVWRTTLLLPKGVQPDAQGVLSSPVYLRADGDPLLMLEDVWRLLRELRLRGVKQIPGIVVDRSIFGDVAVDPGAFDGASDRPYNASPDALMIGFGSVRIVFVPDPVNKTWKSFIDPPVPGIEVQGNVEWVDGACQGFPPVVTDSTLAAGNVRFRVSGRASGACGEFAVYRLALTQQAFAAKVLQTMWQELGGQITGEVTTGSVPPGAVPFAAHESPPLSEVIRLINKRSNNVMTRVLLLTLGAEAGRRPATVQSSVEVARSVLQKQGLSMPGLVLDNGSGLSREGAIGADSLAALLEKAWQSPVMPEYISSLAILGEDGTMRNRLRDPATRLRGHLKSGALKDVRSVAGYIWGASGKRYIVVSMVNHPNAHNAREFENALMNWLARH